MTIMRLSPSMLLIAAGAACARSTSTPKLSPADRPALLRYPGDPEWQPPAPPLSYIRFETTKGVFVLELHRDWGPIGADRLYNLARLGYSAAHRFCRVNKTH